MDKKSKMMFVAGLVLVVIVAFAGCTGSTGTGTTPSPAASNTLRIGVSPSDTEDVLNAYAPLKDYSWVFG